MHRGILQSLACMHAACRQHPSRTGTRSQTQQHCQLLHEQKGKAACLLHHSGEWDACACMQTFFLLLRVEHFLTPHLCRERAGPRARRGAVAAHGRAGVHQAHPPGHPPAVPGWEHGAPHFPRRNTQHQHRAWAHQRLLLAKSPITQARRAGRTGREGVGAGDEGAAQDQQLQGVAPACAHCSCTEVSHALATGTSHRADGEEH